MLICVLNAQPGTSILRDIKGIIVFLSRFKIILTLSGACACDLKTSLAGGLVAAALLLRLTRSRVFGRADWSVTQ